jgi:hypothetical protein
MGNSSIVIPAKAGIQGKRRSGRPWTPASAGVTNSKKEGPVRILLSVAALLVTASCAPSAHLTLSNFRFEHAGVEAVVTANPDCSAHDGAATTFDLPFKGTRVIHAPPAADICWRRRIGDAPGTERWGEWHRAFTASGRSIDSEL